jgi:thiamine-phosphate pyrophosphorylase
LTRPIVCLVTDRKTTPRPILELVHDAAHAGISLIQIRERDLDDRALMALTRAAVEVTAATAARVIVNDRLDIALAARAAGVHLRENSFSVARVRSIVPAGFIVGRSVHSEDTAAAIDEAGGCDYLTFGTVFPSASKAAGHAATGVAGLRRVCERVRLPVLAIGGLSVDNAGEAAAAGAAGLAAIGLFSGASDLRRTVRAIARAFDT